MKFDVITFGSATVDIFLTLKRKSWKIIKEKSFLSQKGLCFDFGSKIEIADLKVFSGGGGTNTAVSFKNLGLSSIYCGKIGNDPLKELISSELEQFKIPLKFLKVDPKRKNAISVILTTGFTRTILIKRGACHFLSEKDIPFEKLKAKWFYLAPLSGASARVFKNLVNFAQKNNIKIAANLGNSQINLGKKILLPLLEKIDVLILNKEEASLLTKISPEKEKEILKKLKKIGSKIIVITKGKEGSLVLFDRFLYKAGVLKIKPVEKTGAGDAFGSGFIAGLIKKMDLEKAIQLATANASFCIRKVGAKNGLLKRKQRYPKVKVKRLKFK